MITTKARTVIAVVVASLSLAAMAGPAMAADHKGATGAVHTYNWDIPAGTASPSA